MLIATVSTIISLIFLIAFVAAIALQVYLSRRKSKLPGLALPGITFSATVHPAERGSNVVSSVADNCGWAVCNVILRVLTLHLSPCRPSC